MAKKRKQYSAQLKAKVAIEAIGFLLLLASSCRSLPIAAINLPRSQAGVTPSTATPPPNTDTQASSPKLSNTTPSYWYAGKFHRFRRIMTADGLPGSRVWNVVQDHQGFMWFAADGGLSRYDGREIKVFQYDPKDPSSMSSNRPRNLFVDRHGTLWITTWDRGFNRYDPATESFTRYVKQEDGQGLSSNALTGIVEDDAGNLWISTLGGGLNRFNPNTGQFRHYKHDPEDPESLISNTVSAIYLGSDQQLWIGTDSGIARFDLARERFQAYRPDLNNPNNPNNPLNNYVEGLYEDSHRNIWISTQGGIARFNRATEIFTAYAYPTETQASAAKPASPKVWTVSTVEDEAGFVWIGTFGNGLYRFDPETETLMQHAHQPSDPYSLSNNSVTYIYKDPNGKIWVPTTNGINLLDLSMKAFTHYRAIQGDAQSLSHNSIRVVYEDRSGMIWFGGDEGLTQYDRRQNQFTHYTADPENPNSLSHSFVKSICEDRNGNLWLGTAGGGLNKLDRSTYRFTHYIYDASDPNSLSNNVIFDIECQGDSGFIWLATWGGGLNRFDPKSETFSHYKTDTQNTQSILANKVLNVQEDRSGYLWIGTTIGLNRFDIETEEFQRFYDRANDPNVIGVDLASAALIETIYEDEQGQVWVGGSAGLGQYDPIKEQFRHYGAENSDLPRDDVRGILRANPLPGQTVGDLWLSFTSQGLVRFNPQTGETRQYTEQDGLQGNSFAGQTAIYKSHTGELFFSGVNGVTAFDPSQIRDNPRVPAVVITDFQLDRKPVVIGQMADLTPENRVVNGKSALGAILEQSISLTRSLTLSYVYRTLDFKFAALNYQSPEQNRYRYQLEGFDLTWTEVGSDAASATYTNLDPGQYTLRVWGSNNDGLWNEAGVAIEITVLPPWWATLWFRGVSGLVVLGSIVASVRWRIRRAERQNRILEQVVSERTAELAIAKEQAEVASQAKSQFLSQMTHELRTPLNAILGYAQILKRRQDLDSDHRKGLKMIYNSAQHLLSLINEILDWAKIEAGRLELRPTVVHFPHFLETVAEMVRVSAYHKGLSFHFEPAANLPATVEVDAIRLRAVLLNLLGNAVKFTDQGQVTFQVSWRPGEMGSGEPGMQAPIDRGKTAMEVKTAQIRFDVIDTGIGIAAADVDLIFQPFEQVITPQQAEGTGLGLTITQEWVQCMGGQIHLSSEVGQGSHFWFELVLPCGEVQRSTDWVPQPLGVSRLGTGDDQDEFPQSAGVLNPEHWLGSDLEFTLPPASVLAYLHAITRFGDLIQLGAALNSLEAENPSYRDFNQSIRHYISRLEDEPILVILTQQLAAQHQFQAGSGDISSLVYQSQWIGQPSGDFLDVTRVQADASGTDSGANRATNRTNDSTDDRTAVILLIDDIQTNLQVLMDTLKPEGFTLISARNGTSGLQRAIFSQPDLILLDVMMPGIDGFETCRRLKAEPATQKIPVLFMTALGDEESKVRGFGVGAVDYITKPIAEQEVLARVRTHLRLQQQQRLLEQKANCDQLTGIANRRQFDRVLEQEWAKALRDATPLALVMMDVDYFKQYNDRYGHPAGDECLKRVAQTLAETLDQAAQMQRRALAGGGSADLPIAARYGGEEFAAILPATDLDTALRVAEEIRRNVERLQMPHAASQVSQWVTLSLGVMSVVPAPNLSMSDLIAQADQALYSAKQQGRNRCGTLALTPHL